MNHLCQQCHCQVEKVSSRAKGWWWKPSFEKLQSSFCFVFVFVFVFVFCRVEILPPVFYFLNSTICFPHLIHVFRYFFPYLVFLLVGDVICQLWLNYINIFAHTFCQERYFVDRKISFPFPFEPLFQLPSLLFSTIFLSCTSFLCAKCKYCAPNIRKTGLSGLNYH